MMEDKVTFESPKELWKNNLDIRTLFFCNNHNTNIQLFTSDQGKQAC